MRASNLEPVLPFVPHEPGLRAHVARVAALSVAAAESGAVPADQIQALEWAALLHHFPWELAHPPLTETLFRDLGLPLPAAPGVPPQAALTIVQTFRSPQRASEPAVGRAAALLESANFFDEQMEDLPYEDLSTGRAVKALVSSRVLCPVFVTALDSFRLVSKRQLLRISKDLPVFPASAVKALHVATAHDASIKAVAEVVAADPRLAAQVVGFANSGLSGDARVETAGEALARAGESCMAKQVCGAALQQCFLLPRFDELWRHSLSIGDSAGFIAGECHILHPGEAFVAGMVHDVGRLVFELSPAAPELHAWVKRGFPLTYAEHLVAGVDHAEIGAEILRRWRFPDALIEAVRYHHRPELSPGCLAAAVYGAEEIDEALPSYARDHLAAKRLEIGEIRKMRAAS